MIVRRLLACAVIAAAASSCTAIIGGISEDEKVDVVGVLCKCGGDLRYLGTEAQCRDYLDGRFDGMTAEERQAWLEFYAKECRTCDKAKPCFYRPPVCKDLGCTQDWECCSYPSGGVCKDDGTCS